MPDSLVDPARRRRLTGAGLVLGIFTVIALAFTTSTYAMYTIKGEPFDWWSPPLYAFTEWYLWAAATPLIVGLATRVPFTRATWARALAVHAAGFVVVHTLLQTAFVLFERAGGLWGMDLTFQRHLFLYVGKRAAFGILVYGGIVGVTQARDLYRRYRERELRGAQLETRLARAQLQVLRQQLQPHFLFNTLNTISALMHRDVEAADRVVTRLGDLLRMSLQHADRQEVPLRQELDFLDRYVEIQQTRFQDRLAVRIDVEPETLDALVPSLVLQPLVENAIRHGIEPRTAGGRVEVRARHDDDRLVLEVTDDGPGLGDPLRPCNANGGSGIGLSNTRSRLEQLYGADGHRFTLGCAPGGGLVVRLEIPYRVQTVPTPVVFETPVPVAHG